MTDLFTFLHAMANNLPPDVHIQIQDNGDTLNETTGALTGAWSEDPEPAIVGSGGLDYASPVGFLVNWLTDDVGAHHRIKGKTYFVPSSSDAFTSTGNVQTDVHDSLQTAAQAFVTGQTDNLMVWHRPHGGAGGSAHAVTHATMNWKPCIMTSRRD
jgi:hypothetical protein